MKGIRKTPRILEEFRLIAMKALIHPQYRSLKEREKALVDSLIMTYDKGYGAGYYARGKKEKR